MLEAAPRQTPDYVRDENDDEPTKEWIRKDNRDPIVGAEALL